MRTFVAETYKGYYAPAPWIKGWRGLYAILHKVPFKCQRHRSISKSPLLLPIKKSGNPQKGEQCRRKHVLPY